MTLSSFKKHSKFSIIFLVILLYGFGAYFLGQSESLPKLEKFIKIKGVNTKSDIATPVDSPTPDEDTQTSSIIASYAKQCANTAIGFEISYPKDWFTTYDTEDLKCLYFAPYSFTVPKATDNFSTPIMVEISHPEAWGGLQKFYENPNDFQNVISVKNIEINGKAVEKIEALTTGAGLLPKNMRKISYLNFDNKAPLVITYQQTNPDEDYKEAEKIAEDMTRSLKRF